MSEIFRKIFESSPVAKILVNVDSKIKFINTFALKLFGYHYEELIGQDISILVPKEIKEKHPELVKNFFEVPLPRKMGRGRILFGLKKDGKSFPVEVGLTPIETDDGLFVMSSIIDLTQQYFAEERFRSAVESAPNGMLMIDAKGKIMLVNRQIEILFEYDRKELLGQQIEILVPDDFKKHHPKFVKTFITSPEPRSMGIGRELFGKKKKGTLFPVEIGLQPLHENNDEIYVLASIVDITKRRNAENEIEEKSEELKEFAYRTSHDLKAPLVTISSILKCAEEDMKEGDYDEAMSNITKVRQISSNLQSLVHTILFLTKADLGEEDQTLFDFEKIYEQLSLNYKSQLEAGNIKFINHYLHRKPLKTHCSRLSQVLDNLISNAIKFSNSNNSNSCVQITTYDDLEWFYIQIKDNGIGIPSDKQSEVFSMFKRFHQGIDGHGIGLYMVRKFVIKLNGEISFESNENGTCFFLKFPKLENKVNLLS